MLPGGRLRLRKKVWSKSCVELPVLGKRVGGYKMAAVPRAPAETWDKEWRRASADSLESGYCTLSLSDCDIDPAASPGHSPPSSSRGQLPSPVANACSPETKSTSPETKSTSPEAKPTKRRRSLRRSFGRTYSLRGGKGQDRRHSTASKQSTRPSFGRSLSVRRQSSSSSYRKDNVVHPKAKVTLVTCCTITQSLSRYLCTITQSI